MVFEIKRKFLLRTVGVLDEFMLDGITFKRVNLEQFYTQISTLNETKFRKIDDNFIMEQKNLKTLLKSEIHITQKEYKKAQKNAISNIICKDKYLFKINNLPCKIDVYGKNLSGLVVLEIEFLNLNDATNFSSPLFLQKYILKEITDDENYKTLNLSLWGLENFKFDAKKTIEILDKNALKYLDFPNEISCIDGAKITFFNLAKLIQNQKMLYLKSSFKDSLFEFSLNLRKTRALLKLLSCIFDEKIAINFQNEFKILLNNTNKVQNIDNLIEFIKKMPKMAKFRQNLADFRSIQNDKLKIFLTLQKNENLLKEWQILTKEQENIYKSNYLGLRLKKVVSIALRKQIVKTEQKIFYLNQNSPNLHFFSTKVDFESLSFALNTYRNFFTQRVFEKFILQINEMQELFEKMQNLNEFLRLIDLNFDENGEENLKLKNKISKQINKIKDKILHKKQKTINRLFRVSKILKIYT